MNLDGSYYKQTSDTYIDGDINWKRLRPKHDRTFKIFRLY